jgi:hypothetical protein
VRAISKSTLALVGDLHRVAADRGPFRGDQRVDIASLLQKIASAREPLAIPRIISLALDERREVAEATGDAVESLRRLISVHDLSFFDRAFREVSPWLHPETMRWREMRPADLRAVAALRTGPTLLQLAMCHPSGYVREEAIRRSAACSDGSEIGFLLLRANDWVPPVRELAQSALRARLTVEHVPDLVAALPVLDAMARWGRLGSTQLVDQIDALLRDARSWASLIAASSSNDRLTRRVAYRWLLEGGPYRSAAGAPRSRAGVLSAALRDRDPAIRAWVGRWLISADDLFDAFAGELLRSRVGAVRHGAAQRLLAIGARLPWADLLLDPHGGIRALAQHAAVEAGSDPDDEYRARMRFSEGARLGTALIGLGETGGTRDVETIRPYLAHRQPVVRKAALQALAMFKVDDTVDLAFAALSDVSPAVTRVARDVLLDRPASVPAARVWSTFAEAKSLAGKRAALAVLANVGYWESLPHLLRALADDEVQDLAPRYIGAWLARRNRVFVVPPVAIVDEVRALLRTSSLPGSTRHEVLGVLEARLGITVPRE